LVDCDAVESLISHLSRRVLSAGIYTFDEDIGYIAGLAPGTRTMATAFKEYGESIGKPYKAYYNGKWGIGGKHPTRSSSPEASLSIHSDSTLTLLVDCDAVASLVLLFRFCMEQQPNGHGV
jgi:hypothetical protein